MEIIRTELMESSLPLYQQLYQRYKEAIRLGQLQPGERVPAIRNLASELNLSRGTVETAYQMLISEGYLQSRGPAGTVVSPDLAKLMLSAIDTTLSSERHESLPSAVSALLPLQMGLPALDCFPSSLWQRLISKNMRQLESIGLGYPHPAGFMPLRSSIASYLAVSRGIHCQEEQIFICTGYQGCLDLICRTLIKPGETMWFEDPGFYKARQRLLAEGVQLISVPVDEQGMDIDQGRQLAEKAGFALVTPSHQSPCGSSLSLSRRLQLLQWAQENQSWIIEDDYDSEFRYLGHPLPALKSLDRRGRVLYCGTFSKVLYPGLRIAYLVVPLSIASHFMQSCQQFHGGSSQLLQAAVSDFMQQGHFARHLKKMRQLYAQRRKRLLIALQQFCSQQLQVRLQAGGMHLLAELDSPQEDGIVARYAQEQGLAVQPLSYWCMQVKPPPALLLSFTNVSSAQQADHLAQRLSLVIADSALK